MKHLKLTFLLAILMSMVGTRAFAYDALINGIYYNLNYANGYVATVTSGNNQYSGDIVIPSSVTYNQQTYSVTSIGYQAFYGCSGLTSITIPNSVTSIDSHAFDGCSGLTSLTIPASVTSIGYNAFQSCSSLVSITVDSENANYDSRGNSNAIIETVNNKLITGCKNTIIPNTVTEIEACAFSGVSGLTSISIPENVTIIGDGAFLNCTSLGSITIPSGVTRIGIQTFYGCTGLSSVNLGNVTYIANSAFNGCSSLSSVSIPNSVTTICDGAFGHTGLSSLNIPNNVSIIYGNPFYGCSNLNYISVASGNSTFDSRNNCNAIIRKSDDALLSGCKNTIIPNSVKSIGQNAFLGCTGLTSVSIPTSVTSIGNAAFNECTGLTSISIPTGVTSIGRSAFGGCSGLTSITVPNSVTTIGDYAFNHCSSLTSFTIEKDTPTSISSNVFEESNYQNATLYVPSGCKTAYDAANVWKDFDEIIEIAPSVGNNYITIHTNTTGGNAAIGWHLTLESFLCAESESYEYVSTHTSKVVIDNHEYNFQGPDLSDYNLDTSVEHTIVMYFDTQLTDISGIFINRYNIDYLDMSHFDASCLQKMETCIGGMVALETWILPADLDVALCTKDRLTSIDNTALTHVYCPTNRLDDYKSYLYNSDSRVYNCLEANDAYYGASQTSATVTTAPTAMVLTYTGSAQQLVNAGVASGGTMQYSLDGTSYSTSIPTATNAGSYTVYYKAVGDANHSDSTPATVNATINAKNASNLTINSIAAVTYNGSAQTPAVTVKDGSTTLTSGTHYTVSYSNNTNVGTATVTVTGKGNYTGTNTANFTIEKAPLTITAKSYTINQLDNLPVYEVEYAGFKNNEDESVLTTQPILTCSATDSETPGTYDITPSGAVAQNYDFNYVSGTLTINAVEEVTITMATSSGSPRTWVGYSSKYNLDFTGITDVKAYIAIGFDINNKNVLMARVYVVPAYTGVVLTTSNPGVAIDVPTTTARYYYANLLQPAVDNVTIRPTETIDDINYTNLMVGTLNGGQMGFVTFSTPKAYSNKCFLHIPTNVYQGTAAARQGGYGMVFEDSESTDIDSIRYNSDTTDDAYYDLQGRKVTPTKKGLYIRNGKKIFIK